jgi:hypothetical protein
MKSGVWRQILPDLPFGLCPKSDFVSLLQIVVSLMDELYLRPWVGARTCTRIKRSCALNQSSSTVFMGRISTNHGFLCLRQVNCGTR